jgi:hypothetical protein
MCGVKRKGVDGKLAQEKMWVDLEKVVASYLFVYLPGLLLQ